MGDAAGELADRLHLLALRELGFQALLLGQIDEVEDHSGTGISAAGHFRRPGQTAGVKLRHLLLTALGPEVDFERRYHSGAEFILVELGEYAGTLDGAEQLRQGAA